MINQGLIRDKTRAILNTDAAALNKYKQERALHRKVNNLSKEIDDIKSLLLQVTDRLDKIEK
jgi:hypothetical protein